MTLLVVLETFALLSLSLVLLAVIQYGKHVSRQTSRERYILLTQMADLNDRLMHMSGATWTPPPRIVTEDEPDDSEDHIRFKQGWVEA